MEAIEAIDAIDILASIWLTELTEATDCGEAFREGKSTVMTTRTHQNRLLRLADYTGVRLQSQK